MFFSSFRVATKTPLLVVRYEDLLDPQRRGETLQLVAAFLYARAAPADGASAEAAAAALHGMPAAARRSRRRSLSLL